MTRVLGNSRTNDEAKHEPTSRCLAGPLRHVLQEVAHDARTREDAEIYATAVQLGRLIADRKSTAGQIEQVAVGLRALIPAALHEARVARRERDRMARGISLVLLTSALVSAAVSLALQRRRDEVSLPDRARRCGAT